MSKKSKWYKIISPEEIRGKGPLVYKIFNELTKTIYIGKDKNDTMSRVRTHMWEAEKMGFSKYIKIWVIYTQDYESLEQKIINSIPIEISTNTVRYLSNKDFSIDTNLNVYQNARKNNVSRNVMRTWLIKHNIHVKKEKFNRTKNYVINWDLTAEENARINNTTRKAIARWCENRKLSFRTMRMKGGHC